MLTTTSKTNATTPTTSAATVTMATIEREVTVGDNTWLHLAPEDAPVKRDRREGDDRAQGCEHDQDEVEGALPVREIGEGRLEGEGEQKSAQDLRTGLQHPHFLEDVDPVAIGPLRRALVAPVEGRVASGIPTGRSHVLILARHRCDEQGSRPRGVNHSKPVIEFLLVPRGGAAR